MVAAATIRIMKIAWVTYLGALSRLNAILIPRISAHPPILAQCKVHRPWALFREGMVIIYSLDTIITLVEGGEHRDFPPLRWISQASWNF